MGALIPLLKYLPTVLPMVVELVKIAEKIFGNGNGGSKKDFVAPIVKQAILALEGFSGKDIIDEDKFSDGVGKVVDGVVAILNATGAFKKDNV